MRVQEVPIQMIQPIQRMVHEKPVLHYMRKFLRQGLRQDTEIASVPLVPLDRTGGTERFMPLDGHHRMRAAHETGRLTVAGAIFEDDADLQSDLRARVVMHGWRAYDMASILGKYHDTWESLLAGSDMHHVKDLWMFGDEPYDEQDSIAIFNQKAEALYAEMAVPLGAHAAE